jgi:branched-chain amino acid transport system substrate-binding protein
MSKRRTVVSGLCLLLIVVSVILAACGPAATPTEAPEEPEEPAPAEPTEAPEPTSESIVFGMVAPMTGDAADYGIQLETGVRLAVDEINAAGGIDGRLVELEVCDDKCDPYEASMCAQRMVNDENIFAVIGHVCSSCTLAGGPIYEEAGLTAMTVSSTNPEVTQKGWKHVFRTIAHDGLQGPLMAEFAIEELGATKLAIMYASHDYGQGLLDATVPAVPDLGGEVVAVETYAPGVDKDFSAQLTKIAEADPEALLLLTDYAEGGMITKQRAAAGLGDVPVVASGGNQHQQFIDLGGEGAEGAFVTVYFDPGKPDPKVQEFVDKYLDEYDHMPSEQAGYGYEAPYIYKQAIEKGATSETIHEVLHEVEYDGLTGLTKFGEDGDVTGKGQAILVVKDGAFTSYVPEEAAAEEPAAQPATGEPILFGLAGPMTGSDADCGIHLEKGVRMAIEEINNSGGIDGRPMDIVVCDDKANPTEASLCAQKFVSNSDIFAVMGHVNSSCTLAGMPIYDQAGLTAISPSSTNPEITQKGWEHFFRTIPHDGLQGPLMAEFAIEELGATKLAIMYASHDYGQGLLDSTVPVVPELGGEVVAVETYAPGVDKDFHSQLTKIAEAEPDALLLLTDYAEGGMITNQRADAGLGDVPVVACAACQHDQFIELAGEPGEGAIMLVYFDPFKPDDLTQEFRKLYAEFYDTDKLPTEHVAYGYELPFILKQAIEAGATKETLPEFMHDVEYVGVTGVTKFDEYGDILGKGQAILEVKDGKLVSYVR